MLKKLEKSLDSYLEIFPSEVQRAEKFKAHLTTKMFDRASLTAHYTSSAFVVNKERTKVLLMFHKKLKKWLQPGGHADKDLDLPFVALKEVEEETGLKNTRIISLSTSEENVPLDISIHNIPEHKEVPSHFHYDWRYLVEADENEPLMESEKESEGLQWFTFEEMRATVSDNTGLMRMLEKVITLKK